MKIKKSTIYVGVILLIIVIGEFFFLRRGNSAVNGNAVSEGKQVLQRETQHVVISKKDLNYYLNEIRVKAGQPVSIYLDSSVMSCLRSFNIKDLGVSKYSKTLSDTIDFTPNKKGTFRFQCSMGMGTGTIIVE